MHRGVLTVAVVLTATLMQGCDVGSDSPTSPGSESCEDQTYDLTEPPTRADFGMPDGESTVTVACDGGFVVTLNLPEDASTRLTSRRVNADSYGADDAATGDPTTIDIHSVALDPDDALQVAGGVASDLGMDEKPLHRWRFDIKASPNDSVDSPFLRSKLGYLTAELQLQYLPGSANAYLHLVLTRA